ncbi:MAG: GDP-L-fucose synthase [Bacteroidetes bacterium]|nr:GDP-L-fucose synthase [Bacteroidota bacterium]
MLKTDKIYVAGHRGMVGSAIVRALKAQGYQNLLLKSSAELDLRNQAAVEEFFAQEQPDYVFLAAAKVGGIQANNTYRAVFLYDNLMIEGNIIHAAHRWGVKKLMFLGSSCIYPKLAPQPLKEEYLLSGELEPTNEPYAIAKIAGIKLCEAYYDQYGDRFISVMPTNLYGFGDNYHPENSHVLPGLIHRFHQAKTKADKQVVVWGSGAPLREFMFADDLAEACLFLMHQYEAREFINIGTGEEISIRELAKMIGQTVGFEGDIVYDQSKPDGTPRKLMDVSKLRSMGYTHRTSLQEGIRKVYEDYLKDHAVTV